MTTNIYQYEKFPEVKLNDSFFCELVNSIPLRKDKPPTPEEQRQGYEDYFRYWMNLVRIHYPENCNSLMDFWKTGLILFLEYGNLLHLNPVSMSEYRQEVLFCMFERFNTAYNAIKSEHKAS
jgi:hypothetical protein